MKSHEFHQEEREGISIVSIAGFFSDEASEALKAIVRPALKQRKLHWILDFSRCEILASPGVACLMDLGLVISDDFKGRIVLCGLDSLKQSVLNLAGVDQVVQIVPGLTDAVNTIKGV